MTIQPEIRMVIKEENQRTIVPTAEREWFSKKKIKIWKMTVQPEIRMVIEEENSKPERWQFNLQKTV